MLRQESCHASTVKQSEERTRREPESLVQMPSWPIKRPVESRLGRLETVERPSRAPGDPSGGRLGR